MTIAEHAAALIVEYDTKYTRCGPYVLSMCHQFASECAVNVLSMCRQCAVNVLSMCCQCAVNVPSMCRQCAVNV